MRKIKLITTSFVLLIFIVHPVFAQIFDIDTLVYNGNNTQYINLVILSDGYSGNEMKNFITDANHFKEYLFEKAPYSNYKNYFNIFIVKTPSIASGVKHPNTASDCGKANPIVPVSDPKNYFGSTFDAYGIHRLVVPMNASAIASVLADNFPDYDQVFILANSPFYGGSGGKYATATLDQWSNEVAIHEIGHSFAGLADEYWAGAQYAAEKPNMTQNNNSNSVKWKNWLTQGTGIGIYQFAGQTWYKPANGTCEMEFLNKSYCAVCTETIIERIHQLVNPIKNYSPINSTNTITHPVYFSLNLIKPIPNTLRIKWVLNGSVIRKNLDSVLIEPSSLISGNNTLSVMVTDTTNLTRSVLHSDYHIYITNWLVTKGKTGFHGISSKNYRLNVKLYPNPTSDVLTIGFQTEKQENGSIRIFSSQGLLMQSIANQKWNDSENTITIDLEKYASGTYYIEFKTMNFTHTEKFIKL